MTGAGIGGLLLVVAVGLLITGTGSFLGAIALGVIGFLMADSHDPKTRR